MGVDTLEFSRGVLFVHWRNTDKRWRKENLVMNGGGNQTCGPRGTALTWSGSIRPGGFRGIFGGERHRSTPMEHASHSVL